GLVDDLHSADLHVEHQLDRLFDVHLGGIAAYTEGVLIVVLHCQRRLFSDVRSDQHIHQLFTVHWSRSSSIFTAPRVTNTFSYAASATGLMPATSITSTCARLREARYNFSSVASTTMSAFSRPHCLS